MYWLRSISILALVSYGVLSLAWMSGGWLLVTHAFRLRRGERLIAGLAAGWVLFVVVANLAAHVLPLPYNFWAAAILILIGGVLLAWRAAPLRGWLNWGDLRYWLQVAWLLGLVYVFALIQRGLALFDDYVHLPMVSRMATGDIPPHFYLNPDLNFAYHYGLQVWSASLVRMANFFPWSAWDLAKAVAIAFTLVLGWLWARRMAAGELGAYLGSLLFTIGSGARWLLLLVPVALLAHIQGSIHLINTGADTATNLVTALTSPWVIEGGGVMPFPFAFQNGLFEPVFTILGSTGAMPFMTILLLLLLLTSRRLSISGSLVAALLFASLALNAEHIFVFLWAGMTLVVAALFVFKRFCPTGKMRRTAAAWIVVLVISAILSLVQGGFITETIRTMLLSLQGQAAEQTNVYGFGLRWPFAFYTAHLGILSLFDLRQLFVLLAELGPAPLLIPLVAFFSWRGFKRGVWFPAGLGLAALASFFFGIFFKYGSDRSVTRLAQSALWIFLCLSVPMLSLAYQNKGRVVRYAIIVGYVVATFGGLVTFAIQLTSTVNPQLSYFITAVDASFSREYWNRLSPGDHVLDWKPERSVTIFGSSPQAYYWFYNPLPEWKALADHPDPIQVARAGYRYIYMDDLWWDNLSADLRKALQQPCVRVAGSFGDTDWRRLLDVQACR